MMNPHPKVFISYAGEDRERFVESFATKLRSKGIDTWAAFWEMLPGDKLVEKIFEEGLKNAKAVIIILSKNSVDKPWVREELDASLVKRIETSSKLIPVMIDDCQVPECLKSTVWEKINDFNNYDAEFDRIVRAIFGEYEKPPVGSLPSYAQTVIDVIPGLTKIDSLVLKISCEKAIETGSPFVQTEWILPQTNSLDIAKEDLVEALEILEHKSYIEAVKPMGGDIPAFSITLYGFDQYARIYLENYDSIVRSVALEIVNNNAHDSETIARSLNQPHVVVVNIIELLGSRGLIRVTKGNGYFYIISNISAELKRILR
jgi:hypothetical protein